MKTTARYRLKAARAVTAAFALACSATPTIAENYPSRPVRLIVPFAPGGGSELTARAISQRLSESLGQNFVVEPRPGAASLIGTQIAQKAAPDGYTLLLADSGYTIAAISYIKPPFDALGDFMPVGLIASTPRSLMAHPSFSKSFKDLLAMPKEQTSAIALGTSGGTPQMTYQLLRIKTGLTLNEVSYKGGGPALLDAVAGQIPLVFTSLAAGNPYLKNGRLRGLAITSAKRHVLALDIPTFRESGVEDFVMVNWYGILAPARTPVAIVQLLNLEITKALAVPDMRERLSALAFDVTPATREEFTALLKAELKHWKSVVSTTNMQLR